MTSRPAPAPSATPSPSTSLLTDMYELTMLQGALRSGRAERRSVFELFGRSLPASRRFGVVAGTGRLLDAIEAGFETVGNLIRHHRQKAALSEAMRLVGEANAYISTTEPFKLKGEENAERPICPGF